MNKFEQKISNIVSSWKTPMNEDISSAWNNVNSKIDSSSKIVPIQKNKNWLSLAAAVVVLLSISFLFQTNGNTNVFTERGENLRYYLPDSSLVILNAASSISFNEDNWNSSREISLKGEAYFEVKKGSQFTVNSSKGNVQVLGTSFNIYDRIDSYSVDCYTGKVKVSNSANQVFLTKSTGALLNKNTIVKRKLENLTLKKSWINGVFNFKKLPLHRVFREVELQYNVQLTWEDLSEEESNQLFTGTFEKASLEQTLETICTTMGLHHTENNNIIRIENSK